jgi:hypothetical protein
MTPRQRHIIAILAVADIVVILALLVLMSRPPGASSSPSTASHTPTSPRQACQWQATQLLARTGLGGTVALTPDGPLRFEIAYPLAPGQTADEVAQSVWTAFDIAMALALQEPEGKCAIFTQVEVTILAQDSRADTQISASVSVTDLMDLDAGELSEDQFIERVTYSTSALRQP